MDESTNNKQYWWIKLQEDFFQSKEMKKLRKIAGGPVYTLIYLKMQLLGMKTGGKIYFDGVEDTFAEEIALTIDEEPENVAATLVFLEKTGLAKKISDSEMYLPEVEKNTGSETKWARYKRKDRKQIGQCPTPVQIESKTCPIEIEIEKELEIEKDIEIEQEENKREEAAASSKPARTKEPKHQHGEYKNVLLTDTELGKLQAEFPTDWQQRIEKLSAYMKSTGKVYKDHLATIRNWARMEAERNGGGTRAPRQGSAEDLRRSYDLLAEFAKEDSNG